MKTIYTFRLKNFLYLSLLFISITSCSSFKNSSYDDNDGIYSSTSNRETTKESNETDTEVRTTNAYAEKFKQMQNDLEETEYFTDVDSYVSNQQVDTVYITETSYAGWGNNQNEVNVNYYNNGWNNWGYGYNSWYGPGWNNGFYFGNTWGLGYNYGWNNWGWNSPYYGYGMNNWYNPYYGYNNFYGAYPNNNISYNGGRRGVSGYYPVNSGRISGRTATVTGRNNQIGNQTIRSNRTRTLVRDSNSTSSPRTTTSPRSTTTSPRSISSPRTTTSPRSTTTSPRTTTTPRSTSPPRSNESSGGSFGGSRPTGGSSGGSSGGSRSSGGGSRGGGRGGL